MKGEKWAWAGAEEKGGGGGWSDGGLRNSRRDLVGNGTVKTSSMKGSPLYKGCDETGTDADAQFMAVM